jgi:hypothetical protein
MISGGAHRNRFSLPDTQNQHRMFIVNGILVCVGTRMFHRLPTDPVVDVKLENVADAVEYLLDWHGSWAFYASFLDIVANSVGMDMNLLSGGLHAVTRHEGAVSRDFSPYMPSSNHYVAEIAAASEVYSYSRQADLLCDPDKVASIGKNVFLIDLLPRPFRRYEDATAAILTLLSVPAVLGALLDGYLVLSTGDFHKFNLCSRILALPEEHFLDRLQTFDPTQFNAILQTIQRKAGVSVPAAANLLWAASHNIVEVPGLF